VSFVFSTHHISEFNSLSRSRTVTIMYICMCDLFLANVSYLWLQMHIFPGSG
jgi:hypothetical protein